MTSKAALAVVTMLYNEQELLPIWAGHYARQVGSAHCYVLDHGSTDHATDRMAANVLRLPRSPFNEIGRAQSCSEFCASLLYYYDKVLFTDVDEIVVADPRVAPTLAEYAQITDEPVLHCFGMDLLHDENEEPPLDFERPVLRQRNWLRPSSVLCKPTLISRPVRWDIGFHACDTVSQFADLYLFHLAYVDAGMIMRRQAKRNSVENLGPGTSHHRISPETFLQHIRDAYLTPDRVSVELSRLHPLVQEATAAMLRAQHTCLPAEGLADFRSSSLWKVPSDYRELF